MPASADDEILQLSAGLNRTPQRDLVRILKVSTNRKTTREAPKGSPWAPIWS